MKFIGTIQTNIVILTNTGSELRIRFELTNKSATDVMVLKRNTPLEGLRSDCLIVLVDGEKVPYDGYFVKRKLPDHSEYIRVMKGQTVSNEIDVSEAYDVSRPGNYEVKFDESRLIVKPVEQPRMSFFTANEIADTILNIENEQTNINREENNKLTIGQRMRAEISDDASFEVMTLAPATLRKAKVVGGTEEQKAAIALAHKNAYRYVKKALKEFENDNRYKRWFGQYIDDRAEHVKNVLEKVKSRMERLEFSYHINGSICVRSDYAYTTDGARVIWLCTAFWEAKDEGSESRAGTLVHEHSHASGHTDDFEYSKEDCIGLAKNKPKTAVRNADSYEYYAESHFIS